MAKKKQNNLEVAKLDEGYGDVLTAMVELLEESRRTSARAVNSIMTATYWEIGRRIVEIEQGGEDRAEYGKELIKRLAVDLCKRFGRGFSERSLYRMRSFYEAYSHILPAALAELGLDPSAKKLPTVLAKLQDDTDKGFTSMSLVAKSLPLPWAHYIRLLAVSDEQARIFYEAEALRGGWSVRQLDRQVGSKFYERTLLSKLRKTPPLLTTLLRACPTK